MSTSPALEHLIARIREPILRELDLLREEVTALCAAQTEQMTQMAQRRDGSGQAPLPRPGARRRVVPLGAAVGKVLGTGTTTPNFA